MKMTFHTMYERQERIEYILNTIGFGEPYARFKTFNDRKIIFTTTGVCLVTNNDETVLITAYIARHEEMKKLYAKCGLEMPSRVAVMLRRNRKIYDAQPGAIV